MSGDHHDNDCDNNDQRLGTVQGVLNNAFPSLLLVQRPYIGKSPLCSESILVFSVTAT